jgi:hypothetical protein
MRPSFARVAGILSAALMWLTVQVLINGKVAGFFERSNPRDLPLPNIFGITPNEEVAT